MIWPHLFGDDNVARCNSFVELLAQTSVGDCLAKNEFKCEIQLYM